jgi:hypothetical protein
MRAPAGSARFGRADLLCLHVFQALLQVQVERGEMNAIPFLGWLLDFTFKSSTAVPFWFIWTFMGIGQKYFYFIPARYQSIGFWDCVGLFIVIGILKQILVPSLASVSHTCEKGSK